MWITLFACFLLLIFAVHKLDIVSLFHSLIGVLPIYLLYVTDGMSFNVSR